MKTRMRLLIIGLVLCLGIGMAYAQFANPDQAVAYRQAVMTVIGHHFGAMGAVIKGQQPYEPGAFVQDAEVVAMMAELPWEAMLVPGSYSGNTTLLEKVQSEKEAFMEHALQFEDASQRLSEIADSNDMNAIKTEFGNTAQACKAAGAEGDCVAAGTHTQTSMRAQSSM